MIPIQNCRNLSKIYRMSWAENLRAIKSSKLIHKMSVCQPVEKILK